MARCTRCDVEIDPAEDRCPKCLRRSTVVDAAGASKAGWGALSRDVEPKLGWSPTIVFAGAGLLAIFVALGVKSTEHGEIWYLLGLGTVGTAARVAQAEIGPWKTIALLPIALIVVLLLGLGSLFAADAVCRAWSITSPGTTRVLAAFAALAFVVMVVAVRLITHGIDRTRASP